MLKSMRSWTSAGRPWVCGSRIRTASFLPIGGGRVGSKRTRHDDAQDLPKLGPSPGEPASQPDTNMCVGA